jgi:hypothetical protein
MPFVLMEKKMGALKIIASIVIVVSVLNIVRRLIMGEIKVAAWKRGTITNDDGAKLRLSNSRSLGFSFGFLVISMIIFLVSA